jgi:hypothetical protein
MVLKKDKNINGSSIPPSHLPKKLFLEKIRLQTGMLHVRFIRRPPKNLLS